MSSKGKEENTKTHQKLYSLAENSIYYCILQLAATRNWMQATDY